MLSSSICTGTGCTGTCPISGIDFANSHQHPSKPSLIYITIYVNNKQMKILIDTGAQYTFINEQCLRFFNQSKFSDIGHHKFFMADGSTYFTVTGVIHLNINIGDNKNII